MRNVCGRTMAMVVLAWSASCAANTIEIAPGADLAAQLHALHAGDTLILDDGSYLVNGAVSVTFAGTSAAPIVVRAKDGAHPVVDQVSNQNILDIVDSTFVTLDGITFVHGSRGLRFTGGSDITVQNCVVHDTPYNAIAANDIGYDYARLRFIHNEIYNTGGTAEGFYLGCNDDGCRVHDSLIANNDIHDLNGPTVSQGDGIEIKKGSYANIVRDNVIHDTGYPGITIYDVNGRGAVNIIERNLVWNTGDNGIQVTADAIVRNNIVLSEGAAASAFASNALQNGSAANLTIVNNTFFAAQGDGIHLNSVSGSVRIANNAIYAPNGRAIVANGMVAQITAIANAGTGSLSGVASGFNAGGQIASDFFAASLAGAPPQNVVPKSALLVGTADSSSLPYDDFAGVARGAHHDIGAFRAIASGDPGWALAAAFKVLDGIFAGDFESHP